MHDDAVNAFGAGKSHGLPGFSGIQASEDSAAHRLRVARISFARAHPYHVGIAGVDPQGAD